MRLLILHVQFPQPAPRLRTLGGLGPTASLSTLCRVVFIFCCRTRKVVSLAVLSGSLVELGMLDRRCAVAKWSKTLSRDSYSIKVLGLELAEEAEDYCPREHLCHEFQQVPGTNEAVCVGAKPLVNKLKTAIAETQPSQRQKIEQGLAILRALETLYQRTVEDDGRISRAMILIARLAQFRKSFRIGSVILGGGKGIG